MHNNIQINEDLIMYALCNCANWIKPIFWFLNGGWYKSKFSKMIFKKCKKKKKIDFFDIFFFKSTLGDIK